MNEKSAGNMLFINCADEQAIIALFSFGKKIVQKSWSGKQELSNQLLFQINELIEKNNFKTESIGVFPGPGSYTGLRIGLTVANFLAWSLNIPLFETNAGGKIISGKKDYVLPIYLNDAHITKPKIKNNI